jgi:hypothetical protein
VLLKRDKAEEVAVGVGIMVEVGLILRVGVIDNLEVSVGIDSIGLLLSKIGVGIMSVISSLSAGIIKFKGKGLILKIKKIPNTDKISNIIVNMRYLIFLESIYL